MLQSDHQQWELLRCHSCPRTSGTRQCQSLRSVNEKVVMNTTSHSCMLHALNARQTRDFRTVAHTKIFKGVVVIWQHHKQWQPFDVSAEE